MTMVIYIYCKKEHGGMFAIRIAENDEFFCGRIKLNKIGKKLKRELTK